jgi:cell division septum initiation protein DivIVA
VSDSPLDDPFEQDDAELEGPRRSLDGDAETLFREVLDVVATARSMPLSTSVLIQRDEVIELLSVALDKLPEELREARWLLKEKEEFLAANRREADALLDDVRVQAERMVQRTEIVRQANQAAQRILDDAREEARRLLHEAEDFCDQKLAAFEIVLDRTMKTVQAGRERLQAVAPPEASDDELLGGEGTEGGTVPFFDQDHT